MLSKEDNELLCRVGPGTPTGELLRQYWLPFLLDWEVERDGPPQRVRLLGEDLIAFRDSTDRLGLLGDHCAHRGASLFFARNEDCGLRCVYHGWKYDVDGRCVDMPNEPPESNFKDKIHHTAYPCAERGGVIWAYMGPLNPAPPLPHLEWMDVPEEQRFSSKRYRYANRSGVWNISPQMREPVTSKPHGRWRPLPGLKNDFFINREEQRTKSYSGISEFWAQDAAPQLSMGPIYDRSKEHLGTSDSAIIAVRRRLLRAARKLRDQGITPAAIGNPDAYLVRADALLIPPDQSWLEASEERRKVVAGVNPACPA
jgi:nitrite reductase/ring-hydroxylating ferredoxin subunit